MTTGPGRLVVVGQGYVGLPLAVRACEVGFDVVGLDVDGDRVKRLGAGESTVEDIVDERLQAALSTGRYRPTTEVADLAGFDAAIISVPTPLRDGNPDLSYIEAAAATLAPHVTRGCVVVLESTTYPGTTEELVAPILAEGSGLLAGDDFCLGYSPERIDPGNQTWRFENTPKVVSGVDAASLEAVDALYSRLVEQTVRVSGPKEAELTKLLENTFRHVNIALMNEVAMFAHELGIDAWEAVEAASTKPFGYLRFTPGPGVGGHCLPIDPSYLSWRVKDSLGHAFRFVELANDINAHMPDYVVRRLQTTLNERGVAVQGRRILLVGLAYKRNTGDARETPAGPITRLLAELGADIRGADPHVDEDAFGPELTRVDLTEAELAGADAVVLLVDHDLFDLDLVTRAAPYVLDTRHALSGPNVEHL
jgi:UDP-N-acetyl-D-glucosamine dehydrogenase